MKKLLFVVVVILIVYAVWQKNPQNNEVRNQSIEQSATQQEESTPVEPESSKEQAAPADTDTVLDQGLRKLSVLGIWDAIEVETEGELLEFPSATFAFLFEIGGTGKVVMYDDVFDITWSEQDGAVEVALVMEQNMPITLTYHGGKLCWEMDGSKIYLKKAVKETIMYIFQ